MDSVVVLNQSDVKKIIAKYLGIDEKKIIKSQYSYSIPQPNEEQKRKLLECGIA